MTWTLLSLRKKIEIRDPQKLRGRRVYSMYGPSHDHGRQREKEGWLLGAAERKRGPRVQ
jgi:hypothetical protein